MQARYSIQALAFDCSHSLYSFELENAITSMLTILILLISFCQPFFPISFIEMIACKGIVHKILESEAAIY